MIDKTQELFCVAAKDRCSTWERSFRVSISTIMISFRSQCGTITVERIRVVVDKLIQSVEQKTIFLYQMIGTQQENPSSKRERESVECGQVIMFVNHRTQYTTRVNRLLCTGVE